MANVLIKVFTCFLFCHY
jgi:hypothetical protein